ncbi:hypothetical protein [Lacticaseibacillus sp. GG6-2]
MSKPRSKRKHNNSQNRRKHALTNAQQAALDEAMPDIVAYISEALSNAMNRGIADGLGKVADALKDSSAATALEKQDDREFAPLDDFDKQVAQDEALEDQLAAAQAKEEAEAEPDDDSPDYSGWRQEKQAEDDAISGGVRPDAPGGGWTGADLDPDFDTGQGPDFDTDTD